MKRYLPFLIALLALVIALSGCLEEQPLPSTQPSTAATTETTTVTEPTATQTVPATTQPTQPQTQPTQPETQPTQPETQPPTEEPTQPPVVKESTATVGVVGDILMHGPVINSGYSSGSYDFTGIFTHIAPYLTGLDYAVANMEGTMCGSNNGYSYGGWPSFNCPDAIAAALKGAGFDMLLTANNHSYDTRKVGLLRTQQVIADAGMDYTGTRFTAEDSNYLIRQINGINIGMICYTYNMGLHSDGTVNFNTLHLPQEDARLINTFSYKELDAFYKKLSGELAQMRSAGAEAIILYIHWGNEYQLTPNSTQKTMAQQLCDLGIDAIIGNHPHVIEPMALLTSTDGTHKAVCLYSAGNFISNQRQGYLSSISTAHTEDGLLLQLRFAKYSDGTVLIEGVELLPTWVNMVSSGSSRRYEIIPLDQSRTDWQTAFGLSDSQLAKSKASYDRTMAIVGDGLSAINTWCEENQAAIETALGVQ